MVDPQVGDKVPDSHVGEAKLLAEEEETSGSKGNTNVAHDDELEISGIKDGSSRVKVVDTTAKAVVLALTATLALLLVEVVAGNVGHEVVGPADELLENEVDESVDGRLFAKLAKLVDKLTSARSVLLAGAGEEDHIALHVAGGLVVLGVGDLPAEVGHKQSRVEEPASHIVNELRVREGAVAALVGNDPEASTEETLEDGVQAPESNADGLGGNCLSRHVVVEDVEGGGEANDVADNVAVTLEGRALEAVLGNGIAELLDGEVGRGELVAVCVEQVVIVASLGGGELSILVNRGHGAERGGRGRRTRRVGRGDDGRRLGRVSGDGSSKAAASQPLGREGGGGHDTRRETGSEERNDDWKKDGRIGEEKEGRRKKWTRERGQD